MSYKPKFCCECGENIENFDRKFLSFRHFCELCETRHGAHDKTPWAIAAVGIFIGLFGFGSYLRTPAPEVASAQFISRNVQNTSKPEKTLTNSVESNTNTAVEKPVIKSNQASVSTEKAPTRQAETISNTATEPVYFCGASTKKGTPCSRRVKGGGRCWQHEGQSSMLPSEKLFVGNK